MNKPGSDIHTVYLGCAGWSIGSAYRSTFDTGGTHLERYSRQFNAVEVNSCFYRRHRKETWARWADSTPDDFRFSVKLPKAITHHCRLRDSEARLDEFLSDIQYLGPKAGPMLIQLPPSLAFDIDTVLRFFETLREKYQAQVVCEPRHESWCTEEANRLLQQFKIAGVAADPPRTGYRFQPFGYPELIYYRLHGAPRIYYSEYAPSFLRTLRDTIVQQRAVTPSIWCIFDNTAAGKATANALELQSLLSV